MDTTKEPIAISAVVDVVGALATGSLSGNLYLLDTNRAHGSSGAGTENLRTVVRKGDQLIWTVLPLEAEAYAGIENITIDKEVCEPEKKTYPGTDISFWTGTIKKDVLGTPYDIEFKLGRRAEAMTTPVSPVLVGTPGASSAPAGASSAATSSASAGASAPTTRKAN